MKKNKSLYKSETDRDIRKLEILLVLIWSDIAIGITMLIVIMGMICTTVASA